MLPPSLASIPCPACGTVVSLSPPQPADPTDPSGSAANEAATTGNAPPSPESASLSAQPPVLPGPVITPAAVTSDADTAAPIPPHLRPIQPGAGPTPGPSISVTPPKPGGIQISLADDDARGFRHKPPKFKNLGLILSGISLGLLSLAAVVSLSARMLRPDWFAAEVQQDRIDVRYVRGQYQSPTKWTPAYNKAIEVAGLKIKIERVEIGPVVAKGGDLDIVQSQDDVMQVYISIENTFDEEINYVSWYGNEFTVGDQVVIARLSLGEEILPMRVFEDAAGIYGHLPQAVIRPEEVIQDSIIFDLSDAPKGRTGPWKLELPLASVGYATSIGFEIDERSLKRDSVLGAPGSAFDDDEQ